MAWNKRRTFRKRRSFKKKSSGWGSTLQGVARVAGTALQIGKFVAGLVNAEKKWYDVGTQYSVNTTGFYTPGMTPTLYPAQVLNNMNQGLDSNQREGQSIKMKSLMVRYQVQPAAAATVQSTVRVIAFLDTDAQFSSSSAGAFEPINVVDLMQYTGTAFSILSPMNLSDWPGRFKILHDKTFVLGPIGTGPLVHIENIFIKNPGLSTKKGKESHDHVEFSQNSGGSYGDIRKNPIYLIAFSDDGGTTNTPIMNYISRLRFVDN